MQPNALRVASHYLSAGVSQDAASAMQSYNSVGTWLAELQQQAALTERLIAKGEARRLGRTGAIQVKTFDWNGSRLQAKIQGTSDNYDTRITFAPRPGHHCTCPDWAQNGRRVGPCKHVLRLGEFWRDEHLSPALDRAEDALVNILEHSEL